MKKIFMDAKIRKIIMKKTFMEIAVCSKIHKKNKANRKIN